MGVEDLRFERERQERATEREAYLRALAGLAQCACGKWYTPKPGGVKCTECGKTVRNSDVYIGKPDMPSSSEGGGWGGPKEGHDKDERFMVRGEARDLPDWLYKSWADQHKIPSQLQKDI